MNTILEFIKEDPYLIVAILVVLIVIALQIFFFHGTRKKIQQLTSLFSSVHNLHIVKSKISKDDLESKAVIEKKASNPTSCNNEELENDEQLVNLIAEKVKGNYIFSEILKLTNAYLCKNVGTSADLNVIEDICEKRIDGLNHEITNTINVPLYLGLGGTFIGIIMGVLGVANNIDALFLIDATTNSQTGTEIVATMNAITPQTTCTTDPNRMGNMDPLMNLLLGVGIAMFASFIGLVLMIWNSAIEYKNALTTAETGKSDYFDFVRRELMPTLSNSMATSLNSLRGVLGHFVDNFGRNLDAYADSAQLLNDNLEKQHLVLVEINKLSISETANAISESFIKLKESSEALETFHDYQKGLNSTIERVDESVTKIEDIIKNFKNFSSALNVVVQNQNAASELQQQFKESIEQNFPTGSDAREIWRKQFDYLIEDAQTISTALNNQLAENTEYIKSFVESNKIVFESFGQQSQIMQQLAEYVKLQGECYSSLQKEIADMRHEQIKSQEMTLDLNKDLVMVIKELKNAMIDLKTK